jgi:hypothetical protein
VQKASAQHVPHEGDSRLVGEPRIEGQPDDALDLLLGRIRYRAAHLVEIGDP